MYFDVERIQKTIHELAGLVYSKKTRVEEVFIKEGDFKNIQEAEGASNQWIKVGPDDLWGDKYKRYWIKSEFTIPENLKDQYVMLEVATGKEGQWDAINPQFLSYLNGNVMQGFDTRHRDMIVTKFANEGEQFRVDFNGYSGMGYNTSSDVRCKFNVYLKTFDPVTEKLYYDIKVPLEVAKLLPLEDKKRIDIINHLINAILLIDFRKPYTKLFYDSVNLATEYLKNSFYNCYCGKSNEGTVVCLGHTHIDVAWLWDLKQTREKAVRSFSTVLSLMKEYPEYKFMASQPVLYKFVKEEAPEVYAEIKERIKEGRWEAEGAMWLEADCNLSSGESLVRQLLHGRKFFREEFGVESKILWLPDVFGYSAALPQILKGFGIDYFVTSKISWNEYNKMPYDVFMWEGIDGSEILSYFLTANTYEKVSSGDHRTRYEAEIDPSQIKGSYERFKPKNINDEVIISYGHGDGGGGPTKDMLENYRRLNKGIPGCPKTETKFAGEYFKALEERVKDHKRLPTWKGELYLEYHRGTYTTMGKSKRYNRMCENLLQDVELFSSLAKAVDNNFKYDKTKINENWEVVLLNQFHDIIPGSSVKEVYDESFAQYEAVLKTGRGNLNSALKMISRNVDLKDKAILVFNQLSFKRNEYVKLELTGVLRDKTLVDSEGNVIEVQALENNKVIAYITNIPAKGYKALYLKNENGVEPGVVENIVNVAKVVNIGGLTNRADGINEANETNAANIVNVENNDVKAYRIEASKETILENALVKVSFDENGEITSIYDKKAEREVVKEGQKANAFTMYEDKPHNWDAWDINVYYTEKSWPIRDLNSLEIVEAGAIRATLKIERKFLDSSIVQLIHLYKDSSRIDFETKVNWNETHTLLRTAFPVTIQGNRATYDIQYGNLERDTHFNTSWDMAKFEVCAHKFADLSEYGYGVALLNDCKYGHSIRDGIMSLTLLKASIWPNHEADKGDHEFTYSIFPHEGNVRTSKVHEEGYKLNNRPYVLVEGAHEGSLSDSLSFVKVNQENVVIEVVKEAEESKDTIIRLYETFNKRTKVTLEVLLKPKKAFEVNLEEKTICEVEVNDNDNSISFILKPYEIKTFQFEF
jgi:alpha-mannosidase